MITTELIRAVAGGSFDEAPARWRFNPTDMILINDVTHVATEHGDNEIEFMMVDSPNLRSSLTDAQIDSLREARKFKVRRFHFLKSSPRKEDGPLPELLSDLTPARLRKLFYRVHIVHAIIRLESKKLVTRSDAVLKPAIVTAHLAWYWEDLALHTADARHGSKMDFPQILPPSPTTVRKWLRRYENADLDIYALRDRYACSGNREPRLDPLVRRYMDKYVGRYLSNLKPSKLQLYKQFVTRLKNYNRLATKRNQRHPGRKPRPLLSIPAHSTFNRAIAKLNPWDVLVARQGSEYAKRHAAIVMDGLDVTRPLERVEMDEWKIPLQTILENANLWSKLSPEWRDKISAERWWLSTAIDTVTRIVLAARIIRNPSGRAAIDTMNMGVNDRSVLAAAAGCEGPWNQAGLWENVSFDSGSGYIEELTRAAVVDMGATYSIMPAKNPQLRARQERLYETLEAMLISMFPGRTFTNVVVKGDYDSEANAVLDIEELGRAIVRFIVDVYHVTPHAGLGGATPLDTWIALRKKFRVFAPPDEDRNRHVFGLSVERRISGKGIYFLGLRYQSKALQEFRLSRPSRSVLVRIDSRNLGYISVKGREGWFTVPCRQKGFANVTITQWLLTASEMRLAHRQAAAVYEETVYRAMRDLERFADDAITRAGIASPLLTNDDIKKFEKEVFRGFRFTELSGHPADILDPTHHGLPATTAATGDVPMTEPVELSPTSAAAPVTISSDDTTFFMED